MPHHALDPLDRMAEILMGIILVLTLTGSISVAEAGREDLKALLFGAIGCNLAWGVIDGATYLMAAFMARARLLVTLKAIRRSRSPDAAHQLVVDLLPPALSSALTSSEIETLRQRVNQQAASLTAVTLTRADFLGALGVFLLVFGSTFPVVIPLIVVRQPWLALRLSNAVAVLMLFILGWSLGRYAGRPGWRTGVGMVAVGLVLVAITMALGG